MALPFLRLPWPLVMASAALVLAAPHLVDRDAFAAPTLAWLGLGSSVPITNDYVPVFPWFGMVLAGVAATQALLPAIRRLARWRADAGLGRALVWAGRRSLAIYLVHQPILLGVLYPLALLFPPGPTAQAAPFLRQCERTCTSAGRSAPACARACTCTADELKRRDLWTRSLRDELTAPEREAARALARGCFLAEP